MKKILNVLGKRDYISFQKEGISTMDASDKKIIINWHNITKIAFVDYFEEYSGYFLTEEYKDKELYSSIKVCCTDNIVKVRTGGKANIKKNSSEPFSQKFGTTCLFNAIMIEYALDGKKFLYAIHFKPKKRDQLIEVLSQHINRSQLLNMERVDGFIGLSNL